MAAALPMRVLSRMWQMLLKAIEEVGQAPNAMMAAEMAVIRLTHVADLPRPEELVRSLQDTPPPPRRPPAAARPAPTAAAARPQARGGAARRARRRQRRRRPRWPSAERKRARPLRHVRRRGRADPGQPRREAAGRGRDKAAPRALPAGPDRVHPHRRRAARPGPAAGAAAAGLDRGALGRDAGLRGRRRRPSPRPATPSRLRSRPRPRRTRWCRRCSRPSRTRSITEIRTPEEIAAEAEAEALPEVEEDDEDWDPFEDR